MIRARENKQWKDPLGTDDLLLAGGAILPERGLGMPTEGLSLIREVMAFGLRGLEFWSRILASSGHTQVVCDIVNR